MAAAAEVRVAGGEASTGCPAQGLASHEFAEQTVQHCLSHASCLPCWQPCCASQGAILQRRGPQDLRLHERCAMYGIYSWAIYFESQCKRAQICENIRTKSTSISNDPRHADRHSCWSNSAVSWMLSRTGAHARADSVLMQYQHGDTCGQSDAPSWHHKHADVMRSWPSVAFVLGLGVGLSARKLQPRAGATACSNARERCQETGGAALSLIGPRESGRAANNLCYPALTSKRRQAVQHWTRR